MSSLLLLIATISANSPTTAPEYQGIVLEFSATWCGPCKEMKPLVERLERQGYPIRKIDVDRDKALARKFRITSIPAFVLVVKGKEVSRSVGRQSETQLKRMMARIPREAPQRESIVAVSDNNSTDIPPTPPNEKPSRPEADKPKRRFFPRIPLPLFNSEKEKPEVAALGNVPHTIRGNTPESDNNQAAARFDPMAASTRIKIKDAKGMNYGSGTIIDSRPGRTLILTCGHIFRDFTDESQVQVDVFVDGRAETYIGKIVRYDLEADVGLITIASDVPLPKARLAAVDNGPAPNGRVFSIGCGGGDEPSRQNIRVTKLNPYLGPDCLECTGVPIQGRSGGGLFNPQGEVVGVCVAADPKQGTGLYAGLKAIHALLNNKPKTPATEGRLAKGSDNSVPLDAAEDRRFDNAGAGTDAAADFGHAIDIADAVNRQTPLMPNDAVATAGMGTADLPEGAEVICIIRSHKNPRETSRVVIINRASPKFLAYLRGEIEEQPQPTSVRRPVSSGEELATSRTAMFVDPIVTTRDETTTRNSSRTVQPTERTSERARTTPRWHAATRTPTLPAKEVPMRYRRSATSRQ